MPTQANVHLPEQGWTGGLADRWERCLDKGNSALSSHSVFGPNEWRGVWRTQPGPKIQMNKITSSVGVAKKKEQEHPQPFSQRPYWFELSSSRQRKAVQPKEMKLLVLIEMPAGPSLCAAPVSKPFFDEYIYIYMYNVVYTYIYIELALLHTALIAERGRTSNDNF